MAMDGREDEVADVARRAAMAASAKRQQVRDAGDAPTVEDVDDTMLSRIGTALERIEYRCANFSGAMLFRGSDAQPIVSLLPDFGSEEARRTISRVATAVRMQFDLLADSSLGAYLDSVISTERGAVLVNMIDQDMLIVAVAGSPPDVGPAWNAIAAERSEIREAAAKLFVR
jgi:hypothetical protein